MANYQDFSATIIKDIPTPVRHFIGVFLGTFIAVIFAAIIDQGGVTGVVWGTLLGHALDSGVISAIGAVGVFWITPLSGSYGVGAKALASQNQDTATTPPIVPSTDIPSSDGKS